MPAGVYERKAIRNPRRKVNIAYRFWSKVDASGECWLFLGSDRGNGYGSFWLDGRTEAAHVVAWILKHGPVPVGYQVCHTCDVRNCVRDEHLFLGTSSDNTQDMLTKRRNNPCKGVQHPYAKVTETQVAEIITLCSQGMLQRIVAAKFNMTQQGISDIVRRKNWKHLNV